MKNLTLIDPMCVQDSFCEGIGNIVKVGENFRITLFATREDDPKIKEYHAVVRLVVPKSAIGSMVSQLESATRDLPFVDAEPNDQRSRTLS